MTAKFFVNDTPSTPGNFLVMAIYKSSAPGVLIDSIQLIPPYGVTQEIQFLALDQVEYNYKLFESVDASPVGNIRNSGAFQPGDTSTTVRGDLYLEANVTPGFASGQPSYVNATMVGWDYDAERVGQGTMYPDNAPDISDPDYTQDPGGGFSLIRPGDIFADNEKVVVRFRPQIAPASISSGTAQIISSSQIIAVDTALDATAMGKAILIQGSGDSVTATLPSLASIPDNVPIFFMSRGGVHTSAPIQRAGGDTINWRKNTRIILNQNEQLCLFKAFGVWNVMSISDSVLRVGEIFWSHTDTMPGCFELYGDILNRIKYARIWDYINTDIDGTAIVTEANWGNVQSLDGINYPVNKGKFTKGDLAATFRLPDFRNRFIRGLDDAARDPGSFQQDAIIKHKHDTRFSGPGAGFTNGKGPTKVAAGGTGPFSLNTELTDLPYTDVGPNILGGFLQRTDTENRPVNAALYPMIRL